MQSDSRSSLAMARVESRDGDDARARVRRLAETRDEWGMVVRDYVPRSWGMVVRVSVGNVDAFVSVFVGYVLLKVSRV